MRTANSQDDPNLTVLVRHRPVFETELVYPPRALTRIEQRVAAYTTYLEQVRGFARSTCTYHRRTVTEFLMHVGSRRPRRDWRRSPATSSKHFSCRWSTTPARRSSTSCPTCGGFCDSWSLAARSARARHADRYASPVSRRAAARALPWDTVQALLKAIDRTTPMGRRDYAMFLLMATYGLRACEVITLTLDDVEWRAGRLLRSGKRARCSGYHSPTMSGRHWSTICAMDAGLAVRRQRVPFRGGPPPVYRELFLRHRTPVGVLKTTAIIEAFQKWAKRMVAIPFQGAHCLRHSYAVHLLRSGISLKTIGDLLGHRTLESTCVYLRLAVEDLREVAFDLPTGVLCGTGGDVMTATFSSVLASTVRSY